MATSPRSEVVYRLALGTTAADSCKRKVHRLCVITVPATISAAPARVAKPGSLSKKKDAQQHSPDKRDVADRCQLGRLDAREGVSEHGMRDHPRVPQMANCRRSIGVGVTHTQSAGSRRMSVGPTFWNKMICASGSRVARWRSMMMLSA
jgi:hypothetical protein